MAVQNKETKKRGWLRGVIASALSLCVLGGLALLLVPGGPGPGIDGIGRWLSGMSGTVPEGEFRFSPGSNKVYAELTGGIAAAGELGIQVLGNNDAELLREQVRLSHPAIDASGGRAVVYDLGGHALRVIDSGGVLVSQEAAGPIIAASINEKGWYCVSMQGSEGFKSTVTVYSDKGKDVYRCDIGSGYVLDARLYSDNKRLAVLSITDTGGRVSFYDFREGEDVQASYELVGEVILAIRWLSGGDMLAVTESAVHLIDKSGAGSAVYDFGSRRLGGMSISNGDFIALYLLDYSVGNEGRLVTLSLSGDVIGEVVTAGECRAMSVSGGVLAVLWDRGVSMYDSNLNEARIDTEDMAVTDVLAVSGGKILAISPQLSRVTG